MSAICGLLDFGGKPASSETLRSMAEYSAYRGPDGIRYSVVGEVGLAHLALHSTPEAITERQPLVSLDGTVHLVTDARIDNRAEVLELLDLPSDRPANDAELILAAYLHWGTSCTQHLVGDFSFAVWDSRDRRLFCACDPLGVRRFHYARIGSLICFASEAQQILQHPDVPMRLDELTLGAHLCDDVPDGHSTAFRDVRRLPCGHQLIATNERLEVKRWWNVDISRELTYRRSEDYVDHFREVFARAVTDCLHTQADVVGIALSGGLDSTSIAALAQQSLGEGPPRLIAASMFFKTLEQCDERPYIRAMSEALNLEVSYVDVERFWLLGEDEAYRPPLETPVMGWESGCRELFRPLQERGARVVLTGLGGDEVVRGSFLAYADRLWRKGDLSALTEIVHYHRRTGSSIPRALYFYFLAPFLPLSFERGLRRLFARSITGNAYPTVPVWLAQDLVQRVGLNKCLRPKRRRVWRRGDWARQFLHADLVGRLGYESAGLLFGRSADRLGLEARHPFLDRRLIEFVLSIPPRHLFELGRSKPLARRAMAQLLPKMVVERPDKSDLGGFFDLGLRQKEARKIDRLLESPILAELGYVDAEKLRSAYEAYRHGPPNPGNRRVWNAICLELWLREWYDFKIS